ncbi:MAG: AI-2E family transporter [Verrucomicrobia bacterium]|nr:AI-2E family transporter [Verrucomicrobiota bacterium]
MADTCKLMAEEKIPDVSRSKRVAGTRALLTVAGVLVVIAGLKLGAAFFVPVVTAFFLSVLSYPIMQALVHVRIPRFLALIITLVFIVCLVGVIINAGSDLLFRFSKDLPDDLKSLQAHVNELAHWFELQGVKGAEEQVRQAFDWQAIIGYARNADVRNLAADWLGVAVGTAVTLIAQIALVLVLMFFILSEAYGSRSRALAIHQAGGPDLRGLLNSASEIQKYLGMKTIISAICGIVAGLWCWMFNLDYPILWGIVAFVMHFIPAVGALFAGVLPTLLALVRLSFGDAIGIALGFLAINFIIGNFIEPALMGRRFGVSTLVIVLSVWFWGWMWHGVGAFLAVPLTIMIKVVLENSDEFRWVAVTMSKAKVKRGAVVLETPEFDESEMLGGGAATEPPR